MFVVVALTIWAPVRESTTWTLVPVTLSPGVGLTIATTARELGRFPDTPGAEEGALVDAAPGREPHPAAVSARSTARVTARQENLAIAAFGVAWGFEVRRSTLRDGGTGAYIESADRFIAVTTRA
jgi:hypothetical protein